jgi:pimeloyl-ACP methyl ester carboxylesterase
MRRIFVFMIALTAANAWSFDRAATVDSRQGVSVEYWRMERSGASATLILLPGGDGGLDLNAKRGGLPASNNFLIRSREAFADAGFNVLVMGKPGDRAALDPEFRAGGDHLQDLRALVALAQKEFGKPVWLVGTSRGTISAANAAINLPAGTISGLVLTSSITNGEKSVPLPSMDLPSIALPALVMHHRQDECRIAQPDRAQRIVERLKAAPVKKLLLVDGGGGARGNPCEALHYHGYIGMEAEAVKLITEFVKNPQP